MKRLLAVGIATLVGYTLGVVTLLVWSGKQLYEEVTGGR